MVAKNYFLNTQNFNILKVKPFLSLKFETIDVIYFLNNKKKFDP